MQKLVAVLCVLAMMLTMVVPALANPSIGDLSESAVEITTVEDLPEGAVVKVQAVAVENYDNEAVKEAVNLVNGEESTATVEEVVNKLAGELPEEKGNLAEYDFVTTFTEVALVKDGETSFDNEGEVVAPTVTLAVDALKGVNPEDLANYLFMLINPATAELSFIELDPEAFDAEKGEITVELPFLGALALIQKAE